MLTVASLQESSYPVWYLTLFHVIIMNIDSDKINFPFSRSGVPHRPKCCIPSSGFPLYGSPHKTQPRWKSRAGNWKGGSCCDAETKAPAAISSERTVLRHAHRCTFALSNHPHGPSGENSSQARDEIIKSQPHFGFSVVFQRITLSFLALGGNQRLFSYLFCFLLRSFFQVSHKCFSYSCK